MSILALALSPLASADPDEEEIDFHPSPSIEFSAMDVGGSLASPGAFSATPGGAQDITWYREQVDLGQVPHPNTFTPEGLLSEHDLVMSAQPCDRLLCVQGQATVARLGVQPDVRWLAQLGFGTNLDPKTFERPPLNIVAVVDHSGSMGGQPLETVKASLKTVQKQLGPKDQISIVVYGSGVKTVLQPVRGDKGGVIDAAIDSIESQGGTYMELGLETGFELARQTRRSFDGTTRVMLFTDERPNIGNTEANGFMAMARAASADGIGMTTLGVGRQFGAELATAISSVRGGNLYFFQDPADMKDTFADDFDTMVTELAYDLELVVHPAAGTRIAGVYGIPGDAVEWRDDGALAMQVETVFLSKRGGGIFFAFAPDDDGLPTKSKAVASVTLDYTARDGDVKPQTVALNVVSPRKMDVGLARGIALVDEVTTMKEACRLHHMDNDQDAAWQKMDALNQRMSALSDKTLRPEQKLVGKLTETLAALAGRANEAHGKVSRDSVTGLPARTY